MNPGITKNNIKYEILNIEYSILTYFEKPFKKILNLTENKKKIISNKVLIQTHKEIQKEKEILDKIISNKKSWK